MHIISNTTLFAIWETCPIYEVTYLANGGNGGPHTQYAPTPGDSGVSVETLNATGITPANLGKCFKEWNMQPDGNGTSYNPNDPLFLTGNVTLYAIWEICACDDLPLINIHHTGDER